MDDDLIWITFEARDTPYGRRGYDVMVHSTRDAAWAYAEAHGRLVAYTRDKTVSKPRPRRPSAA